MNVKSLGIDIIEIARVRELRDRYGERFLRRIFSGGECEAAGAYRDPGPFLAGRFAAKEAALKALGCGIFSGVLLTDIEVPAKDSGEPFCVLAGSALERARALGIERILLTISHCDTYAVANAVGVGP